MDLRLPRRELVTGRKHIICASCFLAPRSLPGACARCGSDASACLARAARVQKSAPPTAASPFQSDRFCELRCAANAGTCSCAFGTAHVRSAALARLSFFSSSPGGFASARVRRARCGRTLHARVSGLCASLQPSESRLTRSLLRSVGPTVGWTPLELVFFSRSSHALQERLVLLSAGRNAKGAAPAVIPANALQTLAAHVRAQQTFSAAAGRTHEKHEPEEP